MFSHPRSTPIAWNRMRRVRHNAAMILSYSVKYPAEKRVGRLVLHAETTKINCEIYAILCETSVPLRCAVAEPEL